MFSLLGVILQSHHMIDNVTLQREEKMRGRERRGEGMLGNNKFIYDPCNGPA